MFEQEMLKEKLRFVLLKHASKWHQGSCVNTELKCTGIWCCCLADKQLLRRSCHSHFSFTNDGGSVFQISDKSPLAASSSSFNDLMSLKGHEHCQNGWKWQEKRASLLVSAHLFSTGAWVRVLCLQSACLGPSTQVLRMDQFKAQDHLYS